MHSKNVRLLGGLLLLIACRPAGENTELPAVNPIYTDASEVALGGYDAVAYFTENRARPGRSEIETEWERLSWRFASEEHRELFERNPEAYAPRLGGYGAFGMARGRANPGDPEIWEIRGGRLYIFQNRLYFWLGRLYDSDRRTARSVYERLTGEPGETGEKD